MSELKRVNMNYFSKLSNKGFSLVQVLIAAGIASALALQLASIVNNSSKLKKRMIVKDSISSYNDYLKSTLLNYESCTMTFDGVAQGAGELTSLKKINITRVSDRAGDIVLDINDANYEKTAKAMGFKVEEIKFVNCSAVSMGDQGATCSAISESNYAAGTNSVTGHVYVKYIRYDLVKKTADGTTALDNGSGGYVRRSGGIGSISSWMTFPITMYTDKNNVFASCSGTLPLTSDIYNKIEDAKKEICEQTYGMQYNAVLKKCVPNTNTKFAECVDGGILRGIEASVDPLDNTKLKLIPKCTYYCENPGSVGIYKGGKIECTPGSCGSDEIVIITNSGPVCKKIDCESTSTEIKSLTGIDTDGRAICTTLAKFSELNSNKCGPNGFILVQPTTDSGIVPECCPDCPDVSSLCEDRAKTSDKCNRTCKGTLSKIAYTYGNWGSCKRVDPTKRPDGKKTCIESREVTCDQRDGDGNLCCKPEQDGVFYKEHETERVCYMDSWQIEDCKNEEGAGSVIKATCPNGCCDPQVTPNSKYCEPRLNAGRKTYNNCYAAGGSVSNYGGHKYCEFSGNCPGGWTKHKVKTGHIRRCGSSHGFCRDSCCEVAANNNWQNNPGSCSYYNYVCYDTWNVSCDGCNGTRTISAPVTRSLCY